MPEQTNTRLPAPLYAAAGAGDLAYQQLRKLPALVDELGVRVNQLSEKATASLRAANEKANQTDFDKLRDNATTGAVAFAQVASERAVQAYTALVARGERVVGTGVVATADVVNADIETTEEPAAIEAAAPKPRKKATPAKKTTSN
ncbi:hypothetical protein [Actinoplanes sp. NPDC049265]|uniref:hypothetical protein n=1 Tax=Actinoplanes sp. NPDC049265 TaxID=3363902 RepID=UPI00371A28D9